MRHYLESCEGHCINLQAAPKSRQEAIRLIHRHFHKVAVARSFRFVSMDSFHISANESYEVEAFTLVLRHYGEEVWGLVEASIVGGGSLLADFHPTVDDLSSWLIATVAKLHAHPSKLRIKLERVDDFHVLQVSMNSKLLKSITWNVPAPTECHYRLPHPTDSNEYLWGDALITDIELVRSAVSRIVASLLPIVEVV